MSRLGFAVTGVDPSEKSIGTARTHAAQSGAKLEYRASDAEALVAEGLTFDVVLNMEVVEHVADLRGYLESTAALVKPGGLMFVATLNRTLKALALAKVAAEYILRWLPPGTHDWDKFVAPTELGAMLEEAGLKILKTQGISFDPLGWDWRLSSDTDVNYMVVAGR
jgi:2-polyprenyl-6-hydroxyphenyl methylase/3-demethylubiquinone-9 3-methyltransferase